MELSIRVRFPVVALDMNGHSQVDSSAIVSEAYLSQLNGKRVLIDCGHIPLGLVGGKGLSFGKGGLPSETMTLTLDIGVSLYHRLKSMGKTPLLSICFTDTTRHFLDPAQRPWVKRLCKTGQIFTSLPSIYQEVLAKVPKEDCLFSLQTVNSNLFTGIIKKVKKDARTIDDAERVFNTYNVLFTRDNLDRLFGFTNEFILDTSHEESLLGGSWWLNEFSALHPIDYIKAPIAPLKKFGIINLYSRDTGILCPATYGGLLLNSDGDTDHIAVYSRHDDPSIGEKILRGVVSACALSKKHLENRTFLQIILGANVSRSLSGPAEISLLTFSEVTKRTLPYGVLRDIFERRLSYRYKLFL